MRALFGKLGDEARVLVDRRRNRVLLNVRTVQELTPEEARIVAGQMMLAAYDAERHT